MYLLRGLKALRRSLKWDFEMHEEKVKNCLFLKLFRANVSSFKSCYYIITLL